MDDRAQQRDRREAAQALQVQESLGSPGSPTTPQETVAFQAVARLQAVWRGHLARTFVDKLRWQSKSKLQRTFSWGKKGRSKKKDDKKGKDGIKDRSAKEILDGAGVENTKPKNSVRRSMSFDRFRSGVKAIIADPSKADPPPSPAKSKQLLFILLQRGPSGLGLELDNTNSVVNLVPGGAADTQGYFREGDTIASVDGIPLRGRLLQDVMDRHKNSYSFDVWRLTPVRARASVAVGSRRRRPESRQPRSTPLLQLCSPPGCRCRRCSRRCLCVACRRVSSACGLTRLVGRRSLGCTGHCLGSRRWSRSQRSPKHSTPCGAPSPLIERRTDDQGRATAVVLCVAARTTRSLWQ
jgi:hypothetical protein